jgi:hypothetical protein
MKAVGKKPGCTLRRAADGRPGHPHQSTPTNRQTQPDSTTRLAGRSAHPSTPRTAT